MRDNGYDDDDDDDDSDDVKLAAARLHLCCTPSAPRRVLEHVPTCTASRRHCVTVTAATRAASVRPAPSSLPPTTRTSPTATRRGRRRIRRRR